MGVHLGGAVTGEVLGAGGHAGLLQAGDRGEGVGGDPTGVGPEAAGTDGGVVVGAVDVHGRRHVEGDTDRGQFAADRAVDRAGQVDVVHYAQGRVARVRAAVGVAEPGDVASLLVGRDD